MFKHTLKKQILFIFKKANRFHLTLRILSPGLAQCFLTDSLFVGTYAFDRSIVL